MPTGVNVRVLSDIDAGEIRVFDRKTDGTDTDLTYPAAEAGAALTIDINQRHRRHRGDPQMTRHSFRWEGLAFGLFFLSAVGNWAVWKQDLLTPRQLGLTASGVLIVARTARRRRDRVADPAGQPRPHHPRSTTPRQTPPPRKDQKMKQLTRSRDDKWVGGVCGGIATYTGLDANLIRIIVAVGTVLGFGSLIVAYVVAWILMPAAAPAGQQTVWAQATDVPTTESAPAPPSA